jgi:hypothetical protein
MTAQSTQLLGGLSLFWLSSQASWAAEKPEPKKPSFEEYLRESAVSKDVIDRFL